MQIASEIERILADDGRTGTRHLVAQLVELFEGYGVESAKPKEAEEWRDIASAPKDGTAIIGGGNGWAAEIAYDPDAKGWWLAQTHPTDAHDGEMLPTHWRQLPPPPRAMLSAAGDGNDR